MIDGSQFVNMTEDRLVHEGSGIVYGVVVNSNTSGTLKLHDGIDNTDGAYATSTYTTTGMAYATFPTNVLTGTGGTNFVDDVAATGTFTISTSITPGIHAESTVTASTIVDGDTLTIDATVYRFKDTPAADYDVAIGAGDAAALDNLKLAINLSGVGDGTDYYNTGATMVAHPTVVAYTNTDTTQKVVARLVGTASNAEATTSTGGTLTWADTTLGGGTGTSVAGVAPETATIDAVVYSFVTALSETAGAAAVANQVLYGGSDAVCLDNWKLAINKGATEGTNYSTGTVAHPTVNATTNTNTTQVVAADTAGAAGNSIATTETCATCAWGAANLENGLDAETITIGSTVYTFKDTTAAAYDVKIAATEALTLDNLKLAINANGTGDGTDYHAGTAAHPTVDATTNTDTAQTIVSKTIGTTDNAVVTTETCATASWADTTLGGGTGASVTGVATASSTFVIDGDTYYFTDELSEDRGTAVANEILWATNDATALDNMKSAINGSGTEGTDYSTGTNSHSTVHATTNTNTTQVIQAKVFGTLGNLISTTETATGESWTSTVLTGGLAGSRQILNTYTFTTGASQVVEFPDAINFTSGLFATVGGTADITIIYKY